MPQGWRPTHPGDPAPKWGLSRAGRLVVAVTVIAGIVIALMIMATRTAGAADDTVVATADPDSLPPSWNGGQRVEVPDASFAVTFPED